MIDVNVSGVSLNRRTSPRRVASGGGIRLWVTLLMLPCLGASGGMLSAAEDVSDIVRKIDQLFEDSWTSRKTTPAPPANDAEYLRRTYLNLAGRIPSVSEAEEFIEHPSPNKRAELVDRLLEGPGYVRHFANVWRAAYLPELTTTTNPGITPELFDAWIRDHLMRNSPYDEMVRELILTPGPTETGVRRGSLLFYQVKEGKPENIAAGITRSILGVRLECAQCHDHPFAKWKQEEFWSLAAFFADQVPPGRAGMEPTAPVDTTGKAELKIPGKDRTVAAMFLRGEPPKLEGNRPAREVLVEWMVAPGNPYFARAAVNRIWREMFGTGIVSPVDDLDEQNPPSHPEVLKVLAEELSNSGYDLKRLIRIVAQTRAYQLSSGWAGERETLEREFALMRVRPLTVDQLFDSLSQATGYYEPYVEQGMFAETPRRRIQQVFRSESSEGEARTSILQALALMNGEFVSEAVDLEKSRTLSAIIDAPFLDRKGKINAFYLATLTRPPTEEESDEGLAYVGEGETEVAWKERYSDLYWMLLNCGEFVLNH